MVGNSVRNILMVISYNGKNYHGWQIQKNAVTVQQRFQEALYNVFNKSLDIKGCSRTDKGVHANNYYINFKVKSGIFCDRLVLAINSYLPDDIVVKKCVDVDLDFHARYSSVAKEYIYKIWNSPIRNPFMSDYALHYGYPLNVDAIYQASQAFIGEHDFTAFCTLDKNKKLCNNIRKVIKFDVTKSENLIEIKVVADGFLYNMVRIMVGTLIKNSKIIPSREKILDIISSKKRLNAGPTVPPEGLYLNRVFYKDCIYE